MYQGPYGWMVREDYFRWMAGQMAAAAPRRSTPKVPALWEKIEEAYRATEKPRPSQTEVAAQLDVDERTLRRWLRALGIARWADVHLRITAS